MMLCPEPWLRSTDNDGNVDAQYGICACTTTSISIAINIDYNSYNRVYSRMHMALLRRSTCEGLK